MFNRSAAKVEASETVAGWTELSSWFDGAPDSEMKEDVVGLGGYGRTLTVLFSEEVLDDDEDREGDDE